MQSFLTSKIFWKDSAERAVKTAAQTFLVVAGLSETVAGVINVNWLAGLQVGAWAALASVLMSVASAQATNRLTASLVPEIKTEKEKK
jgi:hypothetical protein